MTNTIEPERAPNRWRAFLISFILLFGLGGVWALATPLMGVPDEPAHVIRAASVVRGDIVPRQSVEDPYMSDVDVPEWAAAAHSLTCFAYDPGIPASCQPPAENDDAITLARTSAGLNSPVYYAIVGLPSLVLDGPSALYAMRFVNVALTAALLASAFMGLSQLPRARWSYVGLAAAITPMALFLSGATNPNSIEFASAAALFATLLTVVRTPSAGWLLWERAALVVVTAALLVSTRSISLLWLAIIVVAALVLARREVFAPLLRRPVTWVTVGLAGVVTALTFAWFIRPQPEIADADVPVYPLIGGSFLLGAQVMLDRTLEFASGWIGLFGWIDTPSPTLSVLIWSVVIVGLIAGAALFGRGTTRVVALLFVLAGIALPIVIQGILIADYGIIWQGRYMMAIYLCAMIAVGLALDDAIPVLAAAARNRIIGAVLVVLGIGQVVSFVWVLRRYVVGGGTWAQMLLSPAWQPPLTWIVLLVLFLGFTAASVAILMRATKGAATVDAAEPVSEPTAISTGAADASR